MIRVSRFRVVSLSCVHSGITRTGCEARGGVLPYMGNISMCDPKGCGFSAVLVINWVSILAILPPFWS